MRDPIENISQLQKKLNDLQLENQILKNILDKAGLSYHKELSEFRQNDCKEAYDLEQGKRIIYPQIITENMANQFFGMFWGRQDVYAKRSVNKGTGKAAYYPQCNNLWTSGCHRKLKDGINCKDCKSRSYKTITKFIILNHLQGNSYNGSDVIGVYPLFSNGTCRFMVFDFDNHDKGAEENDFENVDDTWIEEVEAMREICVLNGLPQAEVIYLHYSADNLEEYDARLDLKLPLISVIDKLTERVQAYSKIENIQVGLFRLEVEDFPERVFQEALLNALSHRDYQSNAAVYVKQYPDRIVIENPGGFLDGITEDNIITHPSIPRNKLIAETLQNLKYVQRTGQGVDIIYKDMVSMGKPYPRYRSFNDAVSLTIFSAIDNTEFVKFITEVQDKNSKIMSLAEMMILRDLLDNRREQLSELSRKVQKSLDETKKSCNELISSGLIEIVGKEYMLTAKVYEALKSDVEYTRDKTVQYIKAKNMILEYLQTNDQITSAKIQEMCGFTKQQARSVIDKMRSEKLINLNGKGPAARYVIFDGLSDN